MVARTDITVNFELSPRLVTVAAPSVEVNMQDLHDTLVGIEDSIEGNQHPRLILSAGKEALGGGTSVGITSTMQNSQIAFEARSTPNSSGAATSTGVTLLTDTFATFITNGVLRGALVINHTDSSVCTVLEVLTETTLTHTGLQAGISGNWSINDDYDITNEIQCQINGGNLVAIDSNGLEIDSVFPTVGTQIVRSSASSATTSNQSALEHSVFNNEVILDQLNNSGLAEIGTVYPAGTSLQPNLLLSNAISIAVSQGFKMIKLNGVTAFDNSISLAGYQLLGDNSSQTKITFTNTVTNGMSIERATFTGSLNGALYSDNCIIGAVTGIGDNVNSTTLNNCLFNGDITIAAGNTKALNIIKCGSIDNNVLVIDMNGSTGDLTIQGYSDRIKIINVTSAINMHIAGVGMELEVDASDTAGVLELHGDINFINSSTIPVIDDDTNNARIVDMHQFKGHDAANPATITGDGVTSSVVTVNGKVLTITPSSITRT